MSHLRILLAISIAILVAATSAAAADKREAYFESQVRPLLIKRCASCHGEAKQQGGVRLDRRNTVLGSDPSEGLVTPGKPDDSRLIQVIRYSSDDTQMPPKGKLPQGEIDILTEWVRQGAYWPEHADAGDPAPAAAGASDFEAAIEGHWSFRPLTAAPPLPPAAALDQTEVDRFLVEKLSAAGLGLSSPADRRTLIRRATLDLWGVPPTWEQAEAFVHDQRPDAWPRLVETLLASPLYGQRWGRHWLDIARYADTKGYVFQENERYPFSYTYRDYVVNALNDDKPFDRFVLEQLAADRLGLPEDDPALAALGFITTGPRYLNREPDIIDDRIDLVTRGLMGLTVACARCHDHKYDPVPTADYYSLYGVFASCTEPESLPLVGKIEDSPAHRAFVAEIEKRRAAVDEYRGQVCDELLSQLRERSGDFLLAVLKKSEAPGAADAAYEHGDPRDKLIGVWQAWLNEKRRREHPVFRLCFALAKTPHDQFSSQFSAELKKLNAAGAAAINPRLLAAVEAEPPQSVADLARIIGRQLTAANDAWKTAPSEKKPPAALPDPATEELRRVLYGPGSVTDLSDEQQARLFERDHRDKLRALERKVEEWQVESPDAPPRAMVLVDKPQPVEPVIFLRGDNRRRGDRVPRQAPRIVTGGESRPFTDGSGRLELAKTIVSPANPLTARVIVNRVWTWHFGRGFVGTQSDFGFRGDAPTHPELLDWLAWNFMHTDGWSLKALHRRILLSAAYQQSSGPNPAAAKVDPENQLYWRFPRQRLEFEPMRDSMLAVAGRLDSALGGRPVDIEDAPFSGRRSIYGRIDRNNFSSLLRTFDYPNPDATSPGRPVTTVPQQSLYALNSPFVRSMAEEVARLAAAVPVPSADDRSPQIIALYRRVLARDPAEAEMKLSAEFLKQHPDDLWMLAQALLLTNEFLFVD